MPRDPHLENAVMDVLWNSDDWMTPRRVQDALPADHPVGYTTVMTVLVRLWKKRRLERRREGRAYAYHPVHSRSEHVALRMEAVLGTAGDRSIALARFADQLSDTEREQLRSLLKEGP